jgi:hypothetical protein
VTKAKSKQSDAPTADMEETAYILVLLMAAAIPGIDKAAAYEVMLNAVSKGLSERSAAATGKKVAATAKAPSRSQTH